MRSQMLYRTDMAWEALLKRYMHNICRDFSSFQINIMIRRFWLLFAQIGYQESNWSTGLELRILSGQFLLENILSADWFFCLNVL